MPNIHFDQAEGLRRMLSGSRPRIFTIVSTVSREEKAAMLTNLGASLAKANRSTLLLDATMNGRGMASYLEVPQGVTLLNVARREYDLEYAIAPLPQGFCLATLARGSVTATMRNRNQASRLKSIFDGLARQFEVMLIDTEIDENGQAPLPSLMEGEIVVHVADHASSIKSAYSIIKQVNALDGRRSFGVLLSGTSAQRAEVVYANMAKAASRYLGVSINAIGHVPKDAYVNEAARLGRAVVDVFPTAGASVAFRRLAGYFSCAETPNSCGMMSY